MNRKILSFAPLVALSGVVATLVMLALPAGELTPPIGPPAPTMHSLNEIFDLVSTIAARDPCSNPTIELAETGQRLFLTLEGISGPDESPDGRDSGFELLGMKDSMIVPISAADGTVQQRERSRVEVGEIVVRKRTDRASTALFLKCLKGETIPSGKLSWYQAEERRPYFEYDLIRVHVTAVTSAGVATSLGQGALEDITLRWESIQWKYTDTGGSNSVAFYEDVPVPPAGG